MQFVFLYGIVLKPVWTYCAGWSTFCACGQCKLPLGHRLVNWWRS